MILRRPARRVLTIAHSYAVGVNRRLADELARTGDWEVTALAPRRFRGDFGWLDLQPNPGERCALEGVPVHFSRAIHLMLYGRRLHDLLQQPWDLVHCWEEPYIAAAAQVAAVTPPRVPLVFATFQNIAKAYPPPFAWFERYALARADGVIAFGQTVLDVLRDRSTGGARTVVIPPGVDTGRFRPRPDIRQARRAELGWRDDVPVVGFLGRFVPEKGVRMLTRVLDGLSMSWCAIFVGGGPLEGELRTWAARYPGRVRVETGVDHGRVPEWLNAMDVLCAPSQTMPRWREQFGRMLIEAFACGVPVVASDSGEIPHVVGDAGVIVPEGDAGAWTTAIQRLLEDRMAREALAQRGRRRAVTVYDWSVIARQHAAFFTQVIEGTVPAPGRAA
jgi:glycosyltransferase involved in cell wall biosynthesis